MITIAIWKQYKKEWITIIIVRITVIKGLIIIIIIIITIVIIMIINPKYKY